MSNMGSRTAGRRARRQFSEEFRIGAVRLILDEGKAVGAVARELDLTPSALAQWVPFLWTRRTRPPVTWKTAQNAVSHSAHTHSRFRERRTKKETQPA